MEQQKLDLPPKNPREDASIFIPIGIIAGVILAVMAIWEFANAPGRTSVASSQTAPVTSTK
jgi:hypothetical protein